MVFGMNVGAFSQSSSSSPTLLGSVRIRASYSFRQRVASKNTPVATLVGFERSANGAYESLTIPIEAIPRNILDKYRTLPPSKEEIVEKLFEEEKPSDGNQILS